MMQIEVMEHNGLKNVHITHFGDYWYQFSETFGIRDGFAYAKYSGKLVDGLPISEFINSSIVSMDMVCMGSKRLPKNITNTEKRKKAKAFMEENSMQYRKSIEQALKGLILQEVEAVNMPYLNSLEDFSSYDFDSDLVDEYVKTLELAEKNVGEAKKRLDDALQMMQGVEKRLREEKLSILIEQIPANPRKFNIYPNQIGILLEKLK